MENQSFNVLSESETQKINGGGVASWFSSCFSSGSGSTRVKAGENPTDAINRVYAKRPNSDISSDGVKVYWKPRVP